MKNIYTNFATGEQFDLGQKKEPELMNSTLPTIPMFSHPAILPDLFLPSDLSFQVYPPNLEWLFSPEAVHVMIDLETLGTSPSSKILSIGAAAARLKSPTEVECICNYQIVNSTKQVDSTSSLDTLDWWRKQTGEARQVLNYSMSSMTGLVEGLLALRVYLQSLRHDPKNVFVWGNGADFDLAILSWAYDHYLGVKPPWDYRNARCFRTLKNLYPQIKDPKVAGLIPHRADHDAINQLKWLMEIRSYMHATWCINVDPKEVRNFSNKGKGA